MKKTKGFQRPRPHSSSRSRTPSPSALAASVAVSSAAVSDAGSATELEAELGLLVAGLVTMDSGLGAVDAHQLRPEDCANHASAVAPLREATREATYSASSRQEWGPLRGRHSRSWAAR